MRSHFYTFAHSTSYNEVVEMRKGVKDLNEDASQLCRRKGSNNNIISPLQDLNGDASRLRRRKGSDKNIVSLDI